MGGFDHHSAPQAEVADPVADARRARWGLRLFIIYCVLYAVFIGLVVHDLPRLAMPVVGRVNLALVYGFGLIAAALVMALLYGWLCRASASAGDKGHE